MASRGYKK